MVNCFTKYLTMHCIARTKNVMIKMSALKNLTIGHPGPTVRGPVIHFEKLDILAQGPTVQGQTVRGPNVQGSICPEPLLYRNHYHQCHHPHHHHHHHHQWLVNIATGVCNCISASYWPGAGHVNIIIIVNTTTSIIISLSQSSVRILQHIFQQ